MKPNIQISTTINEDDNRMWKDITINRITIKVLFHHPKLSYHQNILKPKSKTSKANQSISQLTFTLGTYVLKRYAQLFLHSLQY